MNHTTKAQAGFTMVELMISAAILAIVAVVMLYGMALNMQLQYDARTEDTAIADLMAVRDQLLATPFESLKVLYPDGKDIAGVNTVPGEMITISYPSHADVSSSLILVKLDLNWLDHRKNLREKTLSFWKKK